MASAKTCRSVARPYSDLDHQQPKYLEDETYVHCGLSQENGAHKGQKRGKSAEIDKRPFKLTFKPLTIAKPVKA